MLWASWKAYFMWPFLQILDAIRFISAEARGEKFQQQVSVRLAYTCSGV